MSYYFVIVGTKDQPLFEYEFGTSKAGGDGQSKFPEEARRLNQFIVHAALDIAEEVQWTSGAMFVCPISHQCSHLNPRPLHFLLRHTRTTPHLRIPYTTPTHALTHAGTSAKSTPSITRTSPSSTPAPAPNSSSCTTPIPSPPPQRTSTR